MLFDILFSGRKGMDLFEGFSYLFHVAGSWLVTLREADGDERHEEDNIRKLYADKNKAPFSSILYYCVHNL